MIPNPKRKRIKLTKKQWSDLRLVMWEASGGRCEICHRYIPIDGGLFNGPHLHHKRSRGAGGGDTMDNLTVCCMGCHTAAHSGV